MVPKKGWAISTSLTLGLPTGNNSGEVMEATKLETESLTKLYACTLVAPIVWENNAFTPKLILG